MKKILLLVSFFLMSGGAIEVHAVIDYTAEMGSTPLSVNKVFDTQSDDATATISQKALGALLGIGHGVAEYSSLYFLEKGIKRAMREGTIPSMPFVIYFPLTCAVGSLVIALPMAYLRYRLLNKIEGNRNKEFLPYLQKNWQDKTVTDKICSATYNSIGTSYMIYWAYRSLSGNPLFE